MLYTGWWVVLHTWVIVLHSAVPSTAPPTWSAHAAGSDSGAGADSGDLRSALAALWVYPAILAGVGLLARVTALGKFVDMPSPLVLSRKATSASLGSGGGMVPAGGAAAAVANGGNGRRASQGSGMGGEGGPLSRVSLEARSSGVGAGWVGGGGL